MACGLMLKAGVILIAALALSGCTGRTDPAASPLDEPAVASPAPMEHPPEYWGNVISALRSGGRITMRRIDPDPLESATGDLIDQAICFHHGYYLVRSAEVTLPPDQAAVVRTDLAARLASPGHMHYFCGFRPGIFVTIFRLNDEHQQQLAGYGLICFACGEWQFSFRSDDDIFYEAMPRVVYNDLLRVAKATFPQDRFLQAVTPQ